MIANGRTDRKHAKKHKNNTEVTVFGVDPCEPPRPKQMRGAAHPPQAHRAQRPEAAALDLSHPNRENVFFLAGGWGGW